MKSIIQFRYKSHTLGYLPYGGCPWNQYFSSHWNFNGAKQYGHIAMFPEELPKRLIKMFSFVGENVLDPFAGSGTTALAAKHLNRNSIGYEINKEFKPIIQEKLSDSQMDLFSSEDKVLFIDAPSSEYSFDELPYLFHDPHKMDKKIDVKKLQFGSKLDNSEIKRNDMFSVKQVVSPEIIELSTGLTVKLLGIKAKPQHASEAVEFLKQKFKKRKVYLKYDTEKYDKQNNLLCYIYLDNKTFVNMHLIRTKFVDVDSSIDFKYKKSFWRKFQLNLKRNVGATSEAIRKSSYRQISTTYADTIDYFFRHDILFTKTAKGGNEHKSQSNRRPGH